MARSIERIEQELADMDQAIATISADLQDAYSHYLSVLSQVMQKQLIMAAYHICTQGHPAQFLSLSLSEQQKLQADLHELTKQGRSQLSNLLTEMPLPTTPDQQSVATAHPDPEDPSEYAADHATDHSPVIVVAHPLPSSHPSHQQQSEEAQSLTTELAAQMHQIYMQLLEREASSSKAPPPALCLSSALLRWQSAMERKIVDVMVSVSRQANHLLREAHIVSRSFPEKILDAAVRSEEGESIAGPPNILNLTIEAVELPLERSDDDDDDEDDQTDKTPMPLPLRLPPMRVMAVRMRLSELEFADSAVMSWRNKLRDILQQLKQVDQRYQQRTRKLTIAKAESAWQTSWVSEDLA